MKRTLIFVIIMLVLLAACSNSSNIENRTVLDLAGRTVALPSGKICATASSGWIPSQIVMLAGAQAVGIAPASFKSGHTDRFAELFPGTNDILLTDGNEISAEAMLEVGVNVFFASNQAEAETYSNAGLTCVLMNYDTTENLADSFVLIGEIFGGEALEKGQKIHDHILRCEKIAKEYSSKKTEKPVVYYIAATTQSSPFVTQGEETFANKLFDMCGAKQATSGIGTYVTVSAEFIMNANPDYIIIDGYLADDALRELINDPVLKNLDAVKNKKIIIAPIGILRPCMRPGAETGIGILWLLKTMWPEDIDELDIEKSAIEFYQDCFGWNISTDEIRTMLNWDE